MNRLIEIQMANIEKAYESIPMGGKLEFSKSAMEGIHQVLRELKEYKDLEENGLLIKLPCKVGTKRYYIQNNVCINWNDKTNSCPYFRKNKNGEFHQDGCCDCIDREEESRVREHIFTLATMETKYDIFKFENTYETREEAELNLIESKGE